MYLDTMLRSFPAEVAVDVLTPQVSETEQTTVADFGHVAIVPDLQVSSSAHVSTVEMTISCHMYRYTHVIIHHLGPQCQSDIIIIIRATK